jgi:hypothetical protein
MTPNQEPVERWQDEVGEALDNYANTIYYEGDPMRCVKTEKEDLIKVIAHQKALSRAEVLEEIRKEKRELINKVNNLWRNEIRSMSEPSNGEFEPRELPKTTEEAYLMALDDLLSNSGNFDLKSLSDTLAVVDEIKNKEGV